MTEPDEASSGFSLTSLAIISTGIAQRELLAGFSRTDKDAVESVGEAMASDETGGGEVLPRAFGEASAAAKDAGVGEAFGAVTVRDSAA